jgi:Ca-activated chloride channel family protein
MMLRYPAFSRHTLTLALVFTAAFLLSFSIHKAYAAQVTLRTGMAQKVMIIDQGKRQTAYLHINLQGLALPDTQDRAPVNVAIVIDKSGSMSGRKLQQAKRAAIMALGLLDRFDTISIIAYSSRVDVLVPATRLNNRAMIERRIEELFSGGSTALYAGVKEGGIQLERYLDRERVNRLILLSDGLANVGPKSPDELAELGYKLIEKGISVTTLGLGMGYNEDLMAKLANVTDGNHAFVETADELEKFFALELGDITSVVAQDIEIEIHNHPGILPKRTLWRKSTISGNIVRTRINQVYGAQKKDLTLELQLPTGRQLGEYEIADVTVTYKDMGTKTKTVLKDKVALILTRSKKQAEESIDKEIMSRVVALQAIEKNKAAMKLRDQGKIKAARKLYNSNAAYLQGYAKQLNSPALAKQATQADEYSKNLERGKWRKMRKKQKHESRSTGAISKY